MRRKFRSWDIVYLPHKDEIILLIGSAKIGEVLYWSDKYPKEVDTPKCRAMSSRILFQYGIKLGSVK